jgi:predicted nucleic acid-binding protein
MFEASVPAEFGGGIDCEGLGREQVKVFFDTSALIPIFIEDHEHHEPSFKAFVSADRNHGYCAAHSLAEFYAVVTRLPGRHRLGGDQALLFVQEIRERLSIVTLTSEEHFAALQSAAALGIVGGTVYDILLGHCAIKANATALLTWNVKHFSQFDLSPIKHVQTP